jgi:hypothetical protein
MRADLREMGWNRDPFWRDWAMLALSLATVVWVAFVR